MANKQISNRLIDVLSLTENMLQFYIDWLID